MPERGRGGAPTGSASLTRLLGRPNGWPGERWFDIRRLDVLGSIMRDRIENCRRKGFDAVEPDNVDGYANRTGFPLDCA